MSQQNHKDHRRRMRDRFEIAGEGAFNDYEIMEMLLYSVIPRCDVAPIAHALIDGFGSLDRVLEAPKDILVTVRGMGEKSASYIKLLDSLYSRAYHSAGRYIEIRNGDMAADYIFDKQFYEDDTEESVYIMVLDGQCRMLSFTPLGLGWQESVEAYVRAIAQTCFKMGGNNYIMVHNHPSGIALPSKMDMKSSLISENSLMAMGLTMIDSIILADNDYVSFAQSKLLLRLMTKEQIARALQEADEEKITQPR